LLTLQSATKLAVTTPFVLFLSETELENMNNKMALVQIF